MTKTQNTQETGEQEQENALHASSFLFHLPFCVLQWPGDTDYVQQFFVYHSFEVLIHSLFI